MKKIITALLATYALTFVLAQNPGDTIVVQAFDWSMTYGNAWDGTVRDTSVTFPDNQAISFEKVILLYNIRCRDGNVNQSGGNSNGCGEWDYSCNTYVHDSTRIDSTVNSHSQMIITNFPSGTFFYSNTQLYDYIETYQKSVVLNNTISESSSTVGSGSVGMDHTFPTNKNSSKAQYLYTAAELSGAGFSAGTIDAIELNVTSGSEDANFLRILMKHTSSNVLNPSNPDISGFDTVYYHNTSLSTGINRFQFAQPFYWDGTSNIIVEFSFTNSVPASNAVTIEGHSAADSCAMYNNNDRFVCVKGSEYAELPVTNLSSISNEITISFWANGDTDALPENTSIIEGVNASNQRTVNIHFPWNNSRIYWDCGGNGSGGHDRIHKLATTGEYAGNWNHWAFTKNAVTGSMKIYLNGALWHSGTGKTLPIDIQRLVLASNKNYSNNWTGLIKELRIFDLEIGQAEIQTWMNSSINMNHPNYANLVAYYPLTEESGITINDLSNGAQSTDLVGNIERQFNRGHQIINFFTPVNEKPNIEFFQGTYDLTVTNDTIRDSIAHAKYRVREFAVVNNWGVLEDDSIATISDSLYCRATNAKVYDEDGNQIGIVASGWDGILSPGTIILNYYRRFPMRFEIVSLVTPYGVGLDLGPEGETWQFDLTDYMPMLTGNRRITVQRGGQWQEDMDMKFLFIVGTPARDVLEVQQIWRNDSKGYQAIQADDCFEPRTVTLNPNGQSFKVRTSITGHGQEGEFIPRTHYMDIDGGADEDTWQVWKECATNPIYPQGGTWIYDRAGWCPGEPTDVQELDITPFVSAGGDHQIDYGIQSATGTSNYIVNSQLVTYGGPNHTLDASVVQIQSPTNYIEFRRANPICTSPKVVIRNTGATTLTSLTIEYWVNDNQQHETYQWTGSLGFMEEELVELPSNDNLWYAIAGMTTSKFHVLISQPNNGTDEYIHNNYSVSEFGIPDVLPTEFIVRFKTNNVPNESKYELFDDLGNVLFTKDNMSANFTYNDTFNLSSGCYKLVFTDFGDDGLQFWANNDGTGFMQIRSMIGGVLTYFENDFGRSLIYNFTVDSPLSYEDVEKTKDIELYPNPATTEFTLTGHGIDNADVQIYNSIGQQMKVNKNVVSSKMHINTSKLTPGVYLVHINTDSKSVTKRLVIN